MASKKSMPPDEQFALDALPAAAQRRTRQCEDSGDPSIFPAHELVLVRRQRLHKIAEHLQLAGQLAAALSMPQRVLDGLRVEAPFDDAGHERRGRAVGEQPPMSLDIPLD